MTEIDQTDNHRAGFVIKMSRFHREPLRPQVDAHRIEPRHASTQRHQRIHRRCTVQQAFPCAAVKMPAGENHYRQGYQADNQPQAAVVGGDHHVIADHPPDHHRDTHRQCDNRLPAEALHRSDGGFLLALAAFSVIFNRFRAVARFFHRLH